MATSLLMSTRHGQAFRGMRECTLGAKPNLATRDLVPDASDLWKGSFGTGLQQYGARSEKRRPPRAKLAENGRNKTGFKLIPFGQPKKLEEKKDTPRQEEPKKEPGPVVPNLQSLVPNKFPPAYQITAFVAFTMAAYVVQHVTGQLLSTVEQVPYLAQVESLVGVLVVSQFVNRYLFQDTGKVRLESVLDNIQEKVSGNKVKKEPGPQMLEVQLRSLLDDQAAATQDTPVEDGDAVLVKQALVTSLMSFILERENKARRINAVLRRDVEEERARVARMKQAVATYAEKESASLSELRRLTRSTQALRKERDAALANMASLKTRLENTTGQLDELSQKRRGLESLNSELRDRVSTIMDENKRLSTHNTTLEYAKDKAINELQAVKTIADASLMDNKGLQERVQRLAKEREEVKGALGLAKKNLAEAERELAALRLQNGDSSPGSVDGLGEASFAALASMKQTVERTLRDSQVVVAGLEEKLEVMSAEKAALEERLGTVEVLEESLQLVTEEKESLADQLQKAEALGRTLEEVSAEQEALSAQLAEFVSNRPANDLLVQIAELEKSLDAAEAERAAANKRIATLESDQEASRVAIDELETELEDAVQKLAERVVEHRGEMAPRMGAYELELESKKVQIKALTKDINEVQRKRQEAEEAVRIAQDRLAQLEQSRREEVQGLTAELATLRAAGEEAQSVIGHLEEQLQEIERLKSGRVSGEMPSKTLEDVHRNREDANQQLAEARSALSALGEVDPARREERIAALRAEVEAWQVAEGEAEDLVNQLEDQIQSSGDVKAALAAYENALVAKQEEIQLLQAQLATNAAEYARIMEEKEGLQAELEARLRGAEQERDDAIELLADGRDRLAEVKELAGVLVLQLEARVQDLSKAEEQSQSAIALLEERLAGLQAERGTYNGAETEARLQIQEGRIEELSKRLEGVKEEKEEIERALVNAEGNLQRAEAEGVEEKEALAAEIQALSGAESRSRDLIALLEERLKGMSGEVAEKRKANTEAESSLEESVRTLEQELRGLIEQRAGLADTLEQTKAELAAQEEEFAKETEKLRERLVDLEASESGARQKVSQLEEAVKEAERERAVLEAEANEARARAEELEREKAGLLASREADLVAARQERDAVREKFQAAARQLEAAHEGSKSKQRQVAALEGRVAELMSTYEAAQATIEELGSTVQMLMEKRQGWPEGEEQKSLVSQQLEDSRRLKEGLDQELVALQSKLAATETSGRTSAGELQAEVERLRAQEHAAQQEVESLRSQLTAVTSAADERLQSVTAQYTSGLTDKEQEVERLLQGLRSLQQEKEGASAELENVRRQVEQLEAVRERDVKALQARVVQLQEDGSEGSEALESARLRPQQLESGQRDGAEADVAQLDGVAPANDEVMFLRAEREELASSQARMQARLAQLNWEREKLQELVTYLETRLLNTENNQQESLAVIAKLRSDVEAAERAAVDADEMRSQLAQLQTQLQEVAARAPPSEPAKKTPPKSMRKASSPTNGAARKDSDGDISPELKAHLTAYNYEVREQFVDLRKTAKQQSEGVQKLVEALMGQGATEAWARAYVLKNLTYERAKLKKQDANQKKNPESELKSESETKSESGSDSEPESESDEVKVYFW